MKILRPPLILASSLVLLGAGTAHNEQQAAIGIAYDYLFGEGCTRPEHSRTHPYTLVKTDTGYDIIGNTVSVRCRTWPAGASIIISWEAPTAREDGSALAPRDIVGYELRYNGGADVEAVAGTTLTLEDMQPGSYEFEVRAIDISGRPSEWSSAEAAVL